MPIFFQQKVNDSTRLGIWKIEETEEFFRSNVPHHREVTHPHKRLQHLAGRFLLQYLFADFPYELIRIADTRKPFIPGDTYHFSISHCGDYAAAIVSKGFRVGIDIEIPVNKILSLRDKFLSPTEQQELPSATAEELTLLWSAKEAVFKWYGEGRVSFKDDILLRRLDPPAIDCHFVKTGNQLIIKYTQFTPLALAWVCTSYYF